MALSAAEAILNLELDPDHRHFMAILTRKQSVISAVLAATARVTPGRLRGAENDHMADIIAKVKEEKAKIDALG